MKEDIKREINQQRTSIENLGIMELKKELLEIRNFIKGPIFTYITSEKNEENKLIQEENNMFQMVEKEMPVYLENIKENIKINFEKGSLIATVKYNNILIPPYF